MKTHRLFAVILCAILCSQIARAQDMDAAITKLTEDVAAKIKENGNKKVTVLDFTDLEGRSSELGKYIAEQLTVDFVMTKRDFAVLDRANQKRILQELKLNVSGLVNPENAKKLGSFSGVDALIFGTITPVGTNISVTVKIITAETSEVVGGAKAKFQTDDTVQKLTSKPATEVGVNSGSQDEVKSKPAIVKTLGDLRVDLESLRIIDNRDYLITMTLTNANAKKSIWVAIRSDTSSMLTATLTDAGGTSYRGRADNVTGVSATMLLYGGQFHATEIKPGDTLPCTVKLTSYPRKSPASGLCNLQMDFLIGYNSDGSYASGNFKSLLAKMEAE